MLSAHMWGMDQLLADLRHLVTHHAATAHPDFSGLISGLTAAIERAETAPSSYEYRHHLGWDDTWMELDESQIAVVLDTVTRCSAAGSPPAIGKLLRRRLVFPLDDSHRPEIPHSERIFAASKELHDAYAGTRNGPVKGRCMRRTFSSSWKPSTTPSATSTTAGRTTTWWTNSRIPSMCRPN